MRRPPCPNRPRALPSLAMLLCLALNPAAQAADLSARVSPPGPDGTLELTLESSRPPVAEPDLSPLAADFEILGQRVGHRSFMVNNQRSDIHSLTLTLRPRHPGVAEIPAITYGEGTSEALRLEPSPGQAKPEPKAQIPAQPLSAPERPQAQVQPSTGQPSEASTSVLALEAEIQPTTILVQQQAILTARVYTPEGGGALPRPQLYDPRVTGASILPLGEDYGTATRDGLVVDAWILTAGQTAPTQQRARSNPLSLRVEAAPQSEPERPWLPARALTLSEPTGGLAQVPPGGVWQRLITLTVTGQAAGTLPELALAAPYQLETRRGRPRLWDERTPDGVIGSRQEAILVSGREPGLYRLPELRLDWWNIATGAWETAVLPPTDGATASGQDGVEDTDPGKDATLGPWAWGLIGLGLGLGAMLLWRRRTPAGERVVPPPAPETGPPAPTPPSPLEQASEDIRIAYGNGNAGAARAALLAWARLAWPHNPPGNLTQLALRSPEPASRRIALLDQAFFSPDPLGWNHEPLWEDLPAIAAAAAQEPPPAWAAGLHARVWSCPQTAADRPRTPPAPDRPRG